MAAARLSELGEMTQYLRRAVLQETRAFIGSGAREVPIASGPSASQPRGTRSLVATVSQLNLSTAQYQTAWRSCFPGLLSEHTNDRSARRNAHIRTPNGANNVASVAFPKQLAKTDRAMRFALLRGAGQSSQLPMSSQSFASNGRTPKEPGARNRLGRKCCMPGVFFNRVHDSVVHRHSERNHARLLNPRQRRRQWQRQ